MDQQTNNRRIHAIFKPGECWHEMFHRRIDAEDEYNPVYSVECQICGAIRVANGPDYYNDITAARAVLQFAVEQNDAEVVGRELSIALSHFEFTFQANDTEALTAIIRRLMISAALAPPSVLCEAFLGVMKDA